jgi:hypothetical protein
MFHSLSRIEHIDLTGNKLRILNCTEFLDLHALLILNVRSNSISDTVLEPIKSLQKLKRSVVVVRNGFCDIANVLMYVTFINAYWLKLLIEQLLNSSW